MARNGINEVRLEGNLGQDPELRYTTTGVPVVNMTMATNEHYKDKQGDRQCHTEWHRIVAFGKLAESCAEYLTKGRGIYVKGALRTRKWESKDGITRYATEVLAESIDFRGGPRQEQNFQNSEVSSEIPEFREEDEAFL